MKRLKYIFICMFSAVCTFCVTGCSDEPDSENYYTFTGEMMSDYLKTRPQYSNFTQIVTRANMMDLLSTYGHYTCFLPSDSAFATYLQKKGKSSIDQLTDAECDTIARTHLVGNMYSTIEMSDGTLHTANMNRRYIQITHGFDADSNSVVVLNRSAQIYFALQDDSVENGIVQPINMVLESSNSTVADIIKDNPRVGLFFDALTATGLRDSIMPMKDEAWEAERKTYSKYWYTSDFWKEVATVPDTKKIGFTVFVPTDDVLKKKYGIETLEDLYKKACEIYDAVYPDDKDQPYHAFDQLTDRRNPLNRLVAYHILTRDVKGWDYLTPLVMNQGVVQGAIGIHTEKMNPIDWYETMLPHTMMKFEQLTMDRYIGNGKKNERYINRRYDDEYSIEGAEISQTIEDEYVQDAPNGRYFYVNDIVAFTTDVRDKVQNMRIRMDFSTIFPELMTNDIRLNGDPTKDDDSNVADESYKYGRNYYFPQGYLANVTISGNCQFVYRRPHWNFWSYEGDEFNLFGDYDFTFRIPPVPYTGEYQIRLGFCALDTRGVAQIYFDGKPQGIPIDMRKRLDHESIMGTAFSTKDYTKMTDEEKAQDQKILKNKGCYRGAYGGFHSDGNVKNEFVTNPRTYRKVLCQVNIDANKDHYLRIRCTSTSKLGNNNEFMLDYLELVPKSVYGVASAGDMEDDL
ncbi:MAG: fasciclin domain-containing protein [Prevotella sp.]|nr:fasciclin domain-containing protein [Prevotella sp.]MBR2035991.1 fasciclin domain-containing protein [Prevotella sp.]MBR7171603.1 fasciclin domain-containing protein [Prevotella sp.]